MNIVDISTRGRSALKPTLIHNIWRSVAQEAVLFTDVANNTEFQDVVKPGAEPTLMRGARSHRTIATNDQQAAFDRKVCLRTLQLHVLR